MSRTSRILRLLVLSMFAVSLISGVSAQEKVQVIWFVGLGTGTNPEQIATQEAVVAAFNEAHPDIELILNIAPSYDAARDAVSTMIASGQAPDIIGPVGNVGANNFAGSWLDLQAVVDGTGYDLTQFPEASVDFYRTNEGLVGLPLATYPSLLFYNLDLFDEAGLEYPPHEFGAPYILDGEEVEWNWETFTEVAKLLTVDANGADATEEDFDPENIVQFGFINQWNDPRNELAIFGSQDFWDPETNEVAVGEKTRAAAKWIHNAVWNEHFIPNSVYTSSELLQGGGGPFSSGNVAMARTHLWLTGSLADFQTPWDIGYLPTYEGEYTSTLHADTFRVMKTTKNPEATFTVLSYLVGEASLDLLSVYGGMPAREDDRESFFAAIPNQADWAIAENSLNYPDIPSHESWYPNFNKGQTRFGDFQSLLGSNPDIDIDAELDRLEADLRAIVNEVVGS